MSRAIRWALGAAVLTLLLVVGIAGAAAPVGPRLAVVKHNWKPSRLTLLTVNRNGDRPKRLAGGEEDGPLQSITLAPLSWRSDGAELAFTGLGSIVLVKADGSGVRELNVAGAELPVYAPDGNTIAFSRFLRYDEATIWTVDLVSGAQRRLTPERRGLRYIASSYSPDGTILLATRLDSHRGGHAEPVALHLDTGGVTRLLSDGLEPVYSPDGSSIALFREIGERRDTDLFVMNAAGGVPRRLTRTPHEEELFASWDPSGERIAFTRFHDDSFERANSIAQLNADGSCETEVLAQKRTLFYGAAWQPGPGRGAGRIKC